MNEALKRLGGGGGREGGEGMTSLWKHTEKLVHTRY